MLESFDRLEGIRPVKWRRCGSRSLALSSVSEIRSMKASAAQLLFPVHRVSPGCPDLTSRSPSAFLFVNNIKCDSGGVESYATCNVGEAPNLLTITLDILLARPIRGVRLQSLVAFMVNLDDRLRPSADNSGSLHPGSNHGRAPRIHVQRHGCASCPLISDICQDNVRTVAV